MRLAMSGPAAENVSTSIPKRDLNSGSSCFRNSALGGRPSTSLPSLRASASAESHAGRPSTSLPSLRASASAESHAAGFASAAWRNPTKQKDSAIQRNAERYFAERILTNFNSHPERSEGSLRRDSSAAPQNDTHERWL